MTSIFVTGDIKLTLRRTATSGWLMLNDETFGGAGSGADVSDDATEALFNLFFSSMTDADAPLLTTLGNPATRASHPTAVSAWMAKCRMQLPSTGRAFALASSSHRLGQQTGEDMHALSAAEIPSHRHAASLIDATHTHTVNDPTHGHIIGEGSGHSHSGIQRLGAAQSIPNDPAPYNPATTDNFTNPSGAGFTIWGAGVGISFRTNTTGVQLWDGTNFDVTRLSGNSSPHNNVQPTLYLNAMVKL